MTGESFAYVGGELDLFQHAKRWKASWIRRVRPFLRGDVLEVGAGIGANTAALQGDGIRSWHCLEPDPGLVARLREAVSGLPACTVSVGTLESMVAAEGARPGPFDAVLYADVLEHVEDDRSELARAASALRPGGHVIVLGPAHQALFSPFDASIGHYRRYDASMLRAIAPPGLREARMEYLDSAGLLASLANRVLLRQGMPTLKQILFWDGVLVPVSGVLDPVLLRRVGKSILAVWQKP